MTWSWHAGRRGSGQAPAAAWRRDALACLVVAALLPAAARATVDEPATSDAIFLSSVPARAKTAEEVTAHFVADLGHASLLELSGPYDREVDGAFNSAAREAVARELLRTHADEYDFLVAFTGFDFSRGDGVLAFYLGVRNDVTGIGMPPFDESAAFGSAGKLQGYVDMGPLSSWAVRPTDPRFERTLSVLVHEIFHRWAARVKVRTTGDPASPLLLGDGETHWSFLLDSDASVLYGNDWTANGDGTFTSTAALRYLSPLDLYLAGFYGADEVPPFTLVDSAGVDRHRLSQAGVTIPGTAQALTIDDVIAAEGPRDPAASEAQHRFRVGFVYLARPGETVGEEVSVGLEALRDGLMTRFAILTGGRGAVEVFPQPPADADTGEEPPLDGGPLRPGTASIADALAWLRARQGADFSWQDRTGTQLRDTATVSTALLALDPTFGPAAGGARGWLAGRQETTTDSLARQVAAVRVLGADPLPAQAPLLAQQNADGGWGLAAGYRSDPLDTALALQALAPAGASPAVTAAADYLLANRGADGGWGNHPRAASRAAVTAQVLRALHAIDRDEGVAASAAAWLAAKQNADGGFGDSPSTAHDTAEVLLTLMESGSLGAVDHDAADRYLRNRQTVEGSWEGSVYTTATVVSSLQRLAFPNWEVQSVVADPAQPLEGQAVALRAGLRNSGNLPTPAGALRLYRADAGGTLQPIGETAIPALAPLAGAEVAVSWDTTGAPGVHHLVLRADPDGTTAELSETDNEAALDLTVTASPAGVDLTVSPLDVAVSPPQPDELPVELGIAAVVRNLGQTAAASARVVLWKGAPGSGTPVGETTVAIGAQSSMAVSFDYTLTTGGASVFTIELDPDGTVAEADESNNRASFTVTPAASVDLEVTAGDLALLGAARVGADATFRVRFRNRGTVASPTFAARYELRAGAETIPLRTDSLFLEGGQVEERTVLWRVDREGPLTLAVLLDPADVVPEAHEDNNAAELPFTASTAGDPNLTVDYRDVTFTPDPGREGAPLQVSVVVRNAGGGATGPFGVAFFEGDPAHGGVALGAPQTVTGLGAGASTTVAVNVPALAGPADRLVFVVADAAGEVTELQEDDNSTFASLAVQSLPDLAVSAGSLSLAPSQPIAGQPLTLTATVANLGEQPATAVLVRAFDGDPAAGGTQVGGDQTVGPIAGGATAVASFNWTFAAGPDPRQLVVVVDPEDAVVEGNEDNNRAARPIATQQQGDLFASEPFISPDGDGIKDTTALVFHLESRAVAAIEVVDERDAIVRRFALASPAAAGEVIWDGRDERGRVVPDGNYAVRAGDAAGAVLARAAVVVDTNRSSMLLAVDTPFLEVKNLTCQVPNVRRELRVNDAENLLLYEVGNSFQENAALMSIDGSGAHTIESIEPDLTAKLSPGGAHIAWDNSSGGLMVANADGSDARELRDWTLWWDFTADGESLISVDDETITLLSLDGASSHELYHVPTDIDTGIAWYWWEMRLSPDRKHVVFRTGEWDGTHAWSRLWVLDVATGAMTQVAEVADDDPWWNAGVLPYVSWSPDGSRFAFSDRWEHRVQVFDASGALLQNFTVPLQPAASIAAYQGFELPSAIPTVESVWSAVWSDDGDELAFKVDFFEGSSAQGYIVDYGAIFRGDLTAGTLEPVTWLKPQTWGLPTGAVQVAERRGEQWVELGATEAVDGRIDVSGLVGEETTALRLTSADGAKAVEVQRTPAGFDVLPRGARARPAKRAADRSKRSDRRPGLPLWIPVHRLLGDPVPLRPAAKSAASGGLPALATDLLPFDPYNGNSLAWVPFDRALIYEAVLTEPDYTDHYANWSIDLDRDNAAERLLSEYDLYLANWDNNPVSPSRQRIFFDGFPVDPARWEECVEPGSFDHFHSVRSLLNLTADLRVVHVGGGRTLELRGTAVDLNFSHYQLEWTLASQPDSWRPMAPPSNRMALDELLASWFPPGAGSYLVRLTVFDLAGNRRSVQRAASFAEGPSITDVSLSPSLFSPNGDGVLDQTVLSYRVLAPVRLQVDVLGKAGGLVRTYQREHADVGSVQTLAWDGRDAAGRLVANGEYVLRLLGAELPVEVDTIPPALTLAPRDAVNFQQIGSARFIAPTLTPRVAWSANDGHLGPAALYSGVGSSPSSWSWLSSFPGTAGNPAVVTLGIDEYVGRSFRAEASDAAGNRAAIQKPGNEELVLTSFGEDGGPLSAVQVEPSPPPFRPSSDRVRFALGETVRAGLAALSVQYRDGPVAPWHESPVLGVFAPGEHVVASSIPNPYFEVTWDLATVEVEGPLQVRVRAVDVDGTEHLSNILGGVVRGSFQLVGFLAKADEEQRAAVEALAAQAELELDDYGIVFGKEAVEAQLADISLYVTSSVDSRYATPRRLRAAAAGGGYFIFDTSDFRPCAAYDGLAVATTEPQLEPVTGAMVTRQYQSGAGELLEVPCLDLVLTATPERPAEQCGGDPPGRIHVELEPKSLDGTPLVRLTLSRRRADGTLDLLLNQNGPASGGTYDYDLDVDGLPAGEIVLIGTLTDAAERKVTRGPGRPLRIDHQRPLVAITAPLAGQRICAAAGNVGIFGTIDDAGGAGYDLLEAAHPEGPFAVVTSGGPLTHWSGKLDDLELHSEGDLTVRLRAIDDDGYRECADTTFFVDGEAQATLVALPPLVSPNGDGRLDETHVALAVAEALTASVWVAGEDDALVATLADEVELFEAGTLDLSWNGEDDDHGLVPDGDYTVQATVTDSSCGNVTSRSQRVEVDATPPVVALDPGSLVAPIPLALDLAGTVTDRNLESWRLEVGAGADPQTWELLEEGVGPREDAVLATWNTYGLVGTFTLRLAAADRAGNVAEVSASVTLDQHFALLGALAATPRLFSPNGDGRREETAIRFTTLAAVEVDLVVRDGTGALVRTLATARPYAAGAQVVLWEGARDGGLPAADGDYLVQITARPPGGSGAGESASVAVTLDRTPPAVVLVHPLAEGAVRPSDGIVGSIGDAHLVAWTVELAPAAVTPSWVELARGVEPVAAAELAPLLGRPDGDYLLRLRALDEAESETVVAFPFAVDSVAPVVTLVAPAESAVVGDARGPIVVRGSIHEERLREWRIELAPAAAPGAWTVVATGTEVDAQGALEVPWSPGALADGDYRLRLLAVDRAGQSAAAEHAIVLDGTAPFATITQPAAGAFVRGTTAIRGQATDPHLDHYELAVAPAVGGGSGQWSTIGVGTSAVAAGGVLFDWSALPPDGDYLLRLQVVDAVGNLATATVPFVVDQHPPQPPAGLTAHLEGARTAVLAWSAGGEGDLAGYAVYRDGVRITPQLLTSPAFSDANLSEGRHRYTVTAFDAAGNESDPSAAVEVLVDVTPPAAVLFAPLASSWVSGLVEVRGTASSGDDFAEYRLSVGLGEGAGAGGWQLLRRSSQPAIAATLGEWSSVGASEGAHYTFRLEAEDLAGNVSEARVSVTVDNLAPAAPTGLGAVLAGAAAVDLSWAPNSEPDLAGYLLYRGSRLVNATGPVVGSLAPYLLAATTYRDSAVPDGTHDYTVYAMDRAGNLSPGSAPARVVLDNRRPHAEIVVPADGARFESALYVTAASPDLDVEDVQLAWRAVGEATWHALGAADATAPYEGLFEPATYDPALPHGDYELRALARDAGGVDPAPTSVRVTYTDLTAPAAPADLTLQLDGGDAHLSWPASADTADVAGYRVVRRDAEGSETTLTPSPPAALTYVDAGLADGDYTWWVTAVDADDNTSSPSPERQGHVYAATLEQPFTPVLESTTDLAGTGAADAIAGGEVTTSGGATALPPVSTDAEGSFAYPGRPIAVGENRFSVRVTDANGDRSKAASVRVMRGTLPEPPTGLGATVDDHDVTVTWQPSTPGVIGYLPYDGDEPLLAPAEVTPLTATASRDDAWAPASRAVDGNRNTSWYNPEEGAQGDWLEVQLGGPRLVTRVTAYLWSPTATYLQAWDGEAWVNLAGPFVVEGYEDRDFPLSRPYRTDRVRFFFAGDTEWVEVLEVGVFAQPLVAATSFDTTFAAEGVHPITVTAWSDLGFEGPRSAAANAGIGDVTPPSAPALAATVDGSLVHLTWSASPEADLARYDVYRDNARIAAHTELGTRVHDDLRANGTYRYFVTAVDAVGNASERSNEVEVTVSVTAIAPPQSLVVSAPAAGAALDLAWQPGPGSAPAGYRVARATTAGGPHGDLAATVPPSYRDATVANGTRYYYVVRAVDAAGNVSAPSAEASGVPADGAPPPAPTITFPFPAEPDGEVAASSSPIALSGLAEAGAEVALYRDALWRGSTTAHVAPEWSAERGTGFYRNLPSLSPDGQTLLVPLDNSLRLQDVATGAVTAIATDVESPQWSRDGSRVLYGRFGVFYAYELATGASQELLRSDWISGAVELPGGDLLAAGGHGGGVYALWRVDLATDTWESMLPLAPGSEIDWTSLQVASTGRHVAYHRWTPADSIEVLDLVTKQAVALGNQPAPGHLSWSPDGQSLLYALIGPARVDSWRYDVGGTPHAITDGPTHHFAPQWSPDGRAFASVDPDTPQVFIEDAGSGAVIAVPIELGDRLHWSRSGRLAVMLASWWYEGAVKVLTPPGWFGFDPAELAAGVNRFTATASDGLGNVSGPSNEVRVLLPDVTLPDLVVEDLRVVPAAPVLGQPTTVSATVRNHGAPAPASELSVGAQGPQGSVLVAHREPVPLLPPGGAHTLSWTWRPQLGAGRYQLVATADPAELVSERSEDNNAAQRELRVVAAAGPVLEVNTDQPAYGGHQEVRAAVEVFNAGPPFDGRIEWAVEDADGFLVATLPAGTVEALDFNATTAFAATWDTGDTYAGPYRVRARLLDAGGVVKAEALATFGITGFTQLAAEVAAERGAYAVGSSVRGACDLRYLAGNRALTGLVAALRIVAPGGEEVHRFEQPLGALLPGDAAAVRTTWTSAGALGTYGVQCQLREGEQTLTGAESTFELLAGPPVVVGTLELSSRAPAVGLPLVANWRVTNAGATALVALPVTARLVRASDGETLAAQSAAVDLAPGASASRSPSFDTTELGLSSFLLVLEAQPPGSAQPQRLQVVSFATTDHEPPEVALLLPGEGAILGASAALVVEARDRLSSVHGVALRVDGGGWQPAAVGDAAAGTYMRPASGLADGSHTVAARAVDAWDNAAETAVTTFVVDTTPPEIEIAGVSEGGTYGGDVTVTFTAQDVHPGSTVATIDGAPVTSPAVVSAPGNHTLVVAAADAAGNTAQRTVHFAIVGAPSLTLTKEAELVEDADSDGVPSPGDALEYELVLRNVGGGTATGVLLEDPIPAHTALVAGSVTTTQGTVTALSPVRVDLGTIAGGAQATVRLRVRIDDPVPVAVRQVENQAVATSTELPAVLSDDPLLPGAADPTVTAIVAAPLLVATKTAALAQDHDGDGVPSPGDALEYTISVFDVGNTPATAVRLVDPIPAHATVVAGSATTTHGSVVTESPLDVTIGELPPGETAVVRFRVAVELPLASGVTALVNQGTVTSAELPPLLTDDPAVGGEANPTVTALTAAPVLVVAKRDVLVTDVAGDGEPSPGDELLYQLALANNGNTAATELLLEDAVPAGTTLVTGSVQTSQGTVTSGAASPVRVDLGTLAAGADATVSFRVAIASPFPQGQTAVSNQATLASHELPLIPSDDPDTPALGDATVTPVSSSPSLSVADAGAFESPAATSGLPFVVTLSRPALVPVTVHYATLDGTAIAGVDYVATAGDLTIAAGEATATVRVFAIDEGEAETTETFTLRLSAPVGAVLGRADAVGSLLDDDGFGAGFRDGFESGTLNAWSGRHAPVGAPSGATAAASATVAAGGGTAIASDAGVASIGLTGGPQESRGDATGRAPGAGRAPRLSIDAGGSGDASAIAAANEGGRVLFTLTLDRPAEREVTVDYQTADGTAVAGEDYRAARGRLVLPIGASEATLAVGLLDDELLEPASESFTLRLARVEGAEPAVNGAEGAVLDDELCVGPDLLAIGVLPRGTGWRAVRGAWRERSDAATPPAAALCVIPDAAGAELTQEVDLSAFADGVEGGQQAFAFAAAVRVRDGRGTSSAETQGAAARAVVEYLDAETGAVLDRYDSGERAVATTSARLDDLRAAPPAAGRLRVRLLGSPTGADAELCFDEVSLRPLRVPVVSLGDAYATEGEAGSETAATFRVALSCPYSREVGLAYETVDASGRAGEDYRAASGTLTLPPGAREGLLRVPVVGDARAEGHETFRLDVREVGESGAVMPRTGGIGVIADDDFCPRGPAYWAASGRRLPLDELTLGARVYGAARLAALLGGSGGDEAAQLARSLAATKLDLAAGSQPDIGAVVERADAFLAAHPPGSSLSETERMRAEALAERLDAYNESGCGGAAGRGSTEYRGNDGR